MHGGWASKALLCAPVALIRTISTAVPVEHPIFFWLSKFRLSIDLSSHITHNHSVLWLRFLFSAISAPKLCKELDPTSLRPAVEDENQRSPPREGAILVFVLFTFFFLDLFVVDGFPTHHFKFNFEQKYWVATPFPLHWVEVFGKDHLVPTLDISGYRRLGAKRKVQLQEAPAANTSPPKRGSIPSFFQEQNMNFTDFYIQNHMYKT